MGSKTRWRGGGGGSSYEYGAYGDGSDYWIGLVIAGVAVVIWIFCWCCRYNNKNKTKRPTQQKCHCYRHCYCQRQPAVSPRVHFIRPKPNRPKPIRPKPNRPKMVQNYRSPGHTTQRGQELQPIVIPSAPLMTETPMTELEYAINLSLNDCNNPSKSQHQDTVPVYPESALLPNAPPLPSEEPQSSNFSEPPPPSYSDCQTAYYERGNYVFEGEQFQQRAVANQTIHPAMNEITHSL